MAKGKLKKNKKAASKGAKRGANAKHDPTKDAPKIHEIKGALHVGAFMTEVNDMMDEDKRLTKAQMSDLKASLVAVVEQQLQEGNPVNLFGLVKIVPRFHTKGVREVLKVFGDADSGKMKKKYPAKLTMKAKLTGSVGGKKGIELLPSIAVMQKKAGV